MRHQVVIVGGGPVGVALAIELGRRGIDCALIERRSDIAPIPKGQNLTQRSLEHFYFWGIVDQLRAARTTSRTSDIGMITTYGNLMSEYHSALSTRGGARDFYFQAPERLPQYETERVLRIKMAALPKVTARFGWDAIAIEQDASGVRVTIAQEGGADRAVIEADYLVGCDGAHSFVRTQLGIEREGSDFEQRMVLAVFRSTELHDALTRFPTTSTYRAMQPYLKGYWQFFGRVDDDETWFFHAPVPADARTDNFDFHALIQEAAGCRFAAKFDHVGFWQMRVAVAEDYQVGRAFIAGDAAHSHPPYGGFGLNNGLEDVVNLGWKLAANLQGWGGGALLESYAAERRPIFKETGEDFIASRVNADRAFLEGYSPTRDKAAFDRAWADWISGLGFRAPTYEPNYEGSAVVAGPVGGKSSAHGMHMVKARAGHHLTPRRLSSGKNVFEELGIGFTLLAFDAPDAAVQAFEQAAAVKKIPLKIVRDSYAGGREDYESRLILVRPDQYVVWTGDAAPADTDALMARAVGRG